jgi:hypothetical protein
MYSTHSRYLSGFLISLTLLSQLAFGADLESLKWPPTLPGDAAFVSIETSDFLIPHENLKDGVEVARTAPRVDLIYYPEQNYLGSPWSVWGDGSIVDNKYYSAIGDHAAPTGNAFVYEYDPATHKLRSLCSTAETIALPDGHYMPAKIHSRVEMGRDGWLYFATHRGSTRVTIDKYHYEGDWILRTHPESGKTEMVAHGPVPKSCIPTSVLDPERMIFYGGTSAGDYKDKTVTFFAYDLVKRKVLHTAINGPTRCMIFAKSTGRIYYMDEVNERLMRYDPASNRPPEVISGSIGLRAATEETSDGFVYTVGKTDGEMYRFHTRTEAVEQFGDSVVGTQSYTASLDADPSGRYLYYIPGAHGGSQKDGSPVVQFDTRNRSQKVIAFLQPVLEKRYGYVTLGTYSTALSNDGGTLFVTWNGNRSGWDTRGRFPFDTCALTVIHIPESERLLD